MRAQPRSFMGGELIFERGGQGNERPLADKQGNRSLDCELYFVLPHVADGHVELSSIIVGFLWLMPWTMQSPLSNPIIK